MTVGYTFMTVLYGLIGISGALSIIVMVWGFLVYIFRLGTVRREEGIHIMQWGVRLVITSVILIGVMRLIGRWFGI